MKKLFFACAAAVFCFTALQAQDRFFLYGKILAADGTPIPSAQISISSVIGRQSVADGQASSDGSFKLVLSGRELVLMKFSAPLCDSVSLPLLLTTVQRTLNVTVHLTAHSLSDSIAAPAKAVPPIHIKDENTELGIAERLMSTLVVERRLDSAGYLFTVGHPLQRRDPDSLLAALAGRIASETNPMHRELHLLRYLQVCINAKRAGDPAVIRSVFRLVDADSPFWSLAPELLRNAARVSKDAAEYERRVKARTPDPELKQWLETKP